MRSCVFSKLIFSLSYDIGYPMTSRSGLHPPLTWGKAPLSLVSHAPIRDFSSLVLSLCSTQMLPQDFLPRLGYLHNAKITPLPPWVIPGSRGKRGRGMGSMDYDISAQLSSARVVMVVMVVKLNKCSGLKELSSPWISNVSVGDCQMQELSLVNNPVFKLHQPLVAS